MTISFDDQAHEVELHFLGLRDLHERAVNRKIKRGDHEIERLAMRRDVAEAAVFTLREMASRVKARTKEATIEEVAS